MAKSCNDLWSDPHFDLKIGALILGILINAFLIYPYAFFYYYGIVNGYHCSHLTVLAVLIIAHIRFDANLITEVALLLVAFIKLLVVTAIHADEHHPHHWDKVVYPSEEPIIGQASTFHSADSVTTRFYAFIVLNIVCLILIAVDIILRLTKK